MKTKILACIFILGFQFSNAQKVSDNDLIKETLQNYIDGTSYNNLDQIRKAFTENATLYLTLKDGNFKQISPEEYIAFFKGKKSGVFNGREGKILHIEIHNDIASAKAQIANPKQNWRYIDLFLLKKTEIGWRIISKTATRVDPIKK